MRDEKNILKSVCKKLIIDLDSDNKQGIAENIAKLHEAIYTYMETGDIPYEAIDCELMKLKSQ